MSRTKPPLHGGALLWTRGKTMRWDFRVSDELDAAVQKKLQKSGEALSDVVRKLMAEWAGKPALAELKRGRPRKQSK